MIRALLLLLLCAGLAGAGPSQATLKRPEAPVVVAGSALKPMLSKSRQALRLYAWRKGSMQAIPFQIDQRTPEGGYAYPKGDERKSDSNDRLDANDELAFMARDVGDRTTKKSFGLGESSALELVVRDTKGRGWVYLLEFAKAPPPLAKGRYVGLDWRAGTLRGWTGQRVQVTTGGAASHFLDLRRLQFARPKGGFSPDVLDRSKLALRLSYLFLDIHRRMDEVRAGWTAYREGPVRALAAYDLETYLIWGHWIRSTKHSRIAIYGNRLELDAELRLPVALETNRPSELRFSLDFAPSAGKVTVWSNRNPTPIHADGRGSDKALGSLKTSRAKWVAASCSAGAILMRLHLDPTLQKRRHRLFLRDGPKPDPPEDAVGSVGGCGFKLDLSGLPAGQYGVRLTLHFVPKLRPGGEQALLAIDDSPLVCEPTSLEKGK
jgi:hypothetical protein